LTTNYFFSRIYLSLFKALIISGRKKNTFFLYYARECKENYVKNITSPRLTLLIRDNNYETAITYMNPRCKLLVRCRRPLIRWKKQKWSKQTQKRSQAKTPFLVVHQGTTAQLLREKKIPLHNPFKYVNIYQHNFRFLK